VKKILWVKFGWSEFYRGGPVDGNFGWLNENRGKKSEGRGHEAFNFMPVADGSYCCYVPPQGRNHAPWNADNTGWTVICLAKNPKRKGIHVVGWYEDATLIGDWKKPPSNQRDAGTGTSNLAYDWSYCIRSNSAFFVPPEWRRMPFSDSSVRRGKYSFLAGPDVADSPNKRRVLRLLERKIATLSDATVHNPNERNAPNPELDSGDPLIGFGTPEHRKRVEQAAERAVVSYYENEGFKEKTRVAHLNCGYDFVFKKGRTVHHVEVKGTSTVDERLFMTRNENNCRKYDPEWRLGMVTHALTKKPKVKVYDDRMFRAAFDFEPYVFIGERVPEPEIA
jgi:hypothetical protein